MAWHWYHEWSQWEEIKLEKLTSSTLRERDFQDEEIVTGYYVVSTQRRRCSVCGLTKYRSEKASVS